MRRCTVGIHDLVRALVAGSKTSVAVTLMVSTRTVDRASLLPPFRLALILVLLAVARVAKSHGTVAAFVRFDTSVYTLVSAQIGRARENVATKRARK